MLTRPYTDLLIEGIHELRIDLTGDQIRILYFFCYQDFIILTNVIQKNTDKMQGSCQCTPDCSTERSLQRNIILKLN
jgi:phage-related protein